MSEKIYDAVTEDFIRRMRNWAQAEAGCAMSMISSAYSGMPPDTWGDFQPVILEGEAQDTSTALQAVAIRYRQAVMQFWRFEGRSLRQHARQLRPASIEGKPFSYHTFEVWVIKGHDELKAILRVRTAAYHAQTRAHCGVEKCA